MRVIFKVGRCNLHGFRLGVHLTEHDISIQGIRNISVIINDARRIEIHNVNWFNRYSSIVDAQIGEWIIENGWTHENRQPMKLVLFTIEEHGGNIIFRYVGTSRYRKVSSRRLYVEDGQHIAPASFENEIDALWNSQE